MKFSYLLILAVAFAAQVASAETARPHKKGVVSAANDNLSGQGYGMAGCGLGSIAFGDKPGMTQILAATTNGTFGSQTFGISTGTSNCTDSGTVTASNAIPAYVEANREALSTDVARGQGDSVVGLSAVMGCKDSKNLAASLKRNYGTIFSKENSANTELTSSIVQVVKSEPALECRNVI